MEALQEKKDYHKKYHGLHMDDQQIAKTLKQIQQEFLTDEQVINFMTQLNHLELRVKNVAVMKMIQQKANANQANFKDALKKLINMTQKKGASKMRLMRMNTA